jgi:hypothetical protein
MLKKVFGLICTALVAMVLVSASSGCGDDKKKPTTNEKSKEPAPSPDGRR